MREQNNSTSVGPSLATEKAEKGGEIVSIYVDYDHALLQLKRALPWEAKRSSSMFWVLGCEHRTQNIERRTIPEVMVRRWGEAYLAENGVARVFISKQDDCRPQIRDHSNIARAYAVLGAEGLEEINRLIVKESVRLGFGDPSILSADTTAQELPIGYPNEPGISGGGSRGAV